MPIRCHDQSTAPVSIRTIAPGYAKRSSWPTTLYDHHRYQFLVRVQINPHLTAHRLRLTERHLDRICQNGNVRPYRFYRHHSNHVGVENSH